MDKEPDPIGRCKVEEAPIYAPTIARAARLIGVDENLVTDAVFGFVLFKREHGNIPCGNKDKRSGINRKGQAFRAYSDNDLCHCHLDLNQNGDPLIVYRKIADDHIRLVCVTTHRAMFVQKDAFVRDHESELPKLAGRPARKSRPKR